MNPNPLTFTSTFRRTAPLASGRPIQSPSRALAARASLGDPRFDRLTSRPRSGLWDHALLDRLQSPLTRYHD